MPARLYVDYRWSGNFGIGRYSREVLDRLTIPHTRIESDSVPLSIKAIMQATRMTTANPRGVFYSPGFIGRLPSRRVPQLLTVHDLIHLRVPSESSVAKRLVYERIVRPSIMGSGRVITDSSATRDDLLNWLDTNVDVRVAGCGLSPEFNESGPEPAERATFLLVGNEKPHKNMRSALGGLKAVTGARAHWVASDRTASEAIVTELGLQDRVVIHTAVSDEALKALYRSSIALLFPSEVEGFGLPPIEAMACGTPVVFSRTCAPVRENCEIFPSNLAIERAKDTGEWAQAIASLITSAPRITSEESEKIRSQFSWARVAGEVEAALRDTADLASD